LCFLDEHRAARQDLVVPFVDRCIRLGLCRHFDEGEAARPLSLAVDGNTDALYRATSLRERIPQFLLRDGVGEVAYKQLVTHLLLLFGPWSSVVFAVGFFGGHCEATARRKIPTL
jgi:hypothetical protein